MDDSFFNKVCKAYNKGKGTWNQKEIECMENFLASFKKKEKEETLSDVERN